MNTIEQSKNSKITNNKELKNINKFSNSLAKQNRPFVTNLVTPKGKSKKIVEISTIYFYNIMAPALANIFMCSFESNWLRDSPHDFKPVFY